MVLRFTHRVLNKYDVAYNWCRACGLLQTEEPYWLEEAYGTAIADLDTGILQRNLLVARLLSGFLYVSFDRRGAYVDLAGGYGLLTRMMRDVGFDFRWSDKYAPNLLARGFEAKVGETYEAVTAVEILEHVHDPVGFFTETLRRWKAGSIFFTTSLYEGDPPEPDAWWYYAFETGQHVTFYSRRTLASIAKRMGLRLHSDGWFHMLTDKPVGSFEFQVLTGRLSRTIGTLVKQRMRSRTWSDFQELQGTKRDT
jgi:hypothetical protein